jgi:hypothetical protein
MYEQTQKLLAALREIAQAEGRYSMDRLTHAENTVEDMQKLAVGAIAEYEQTQQKA